MHAYSPPHPACTFPRPPRSAAFYNTLKPYCIFDGNTSSAIYHWLVDNNVTMISHMPTWRNELIKRAQSRMKVRAKEGGGRESPAAARRLAGRQSTPVKPLPFILGACMSIQSMRLGLQHALRRKAGAKCRIKLAQVRLPTRRVC